MNGTEVWTEIAEGVRIDVSIDNYLVVENWRLRVITVRAHRGETLVYVLGVYPAIFDKRTDKIVPTRSSVAIAPEWRLRDWSELAWSAA